MDPIKNILKKFDDKKITSEEAEELLKKNLSESCLMQLLIIAGLILKIFLKSYMQTKKQTNRL